MLHSASILLAAVLFSNIVHRFAPPLSAPIVQIIAGVLLAYIPFFEFSLEPGYLFPLFAAPLVFDAALRVDKKVWRETRYAILGSALGLSFLMLFVARHVVYALVPMSMPVILMWVAALVPTDNASVSRRADVPRKMVGILSGEAALSAVLGLLCFQFAVYAVGSSDGAVFFMWAAGGLLCGFFFTYVKYILVKGLRAFGIENVSFFLPLSILTPFIFYVAAEALAFSGLLAVFATGFLHSLAGNELSTDASGFNLTEESAQRALSLTLKGLIFVVFGAQLHELWPFVTQQWHVASYLLVVTVFFTLLRFAWWILFIPAENYQSTYEPISRIKSGVIFSLAGARGAFSLIAVMSVYADFITWTAGVVIISSQLMLNLPLLFVKRDEKAAGDEIMQKIITGLTFEANLETLNATKIVIKNYYSRGAPTIQEEQAFLAQLLSWEKENTLNLLEKNLIDAPTAEYLLASLEAQKMHKLKRKSWHLLNSPPDKQKFTILTVLNTKHVLDKLNDIRNEENSALVDKIASLRDAGAPLVFEMTQKAFRMERKLVQEMFEAGRISYKTARKMRKNIIKLEDLLVSVAML